VQSVFTKLCLCKLALPEQQLKRPAGRFCFGETNTTAATGISSKSSLVEVGSICYHEAMVQLVGILNITPDSFSDGGLYADPEKAIQHAAQLFEDGATLIDVGAESTRPGAIQLSDEEEWQRLVPVLRVLIPKHPGKISLDSYHPATIVKAFDIGPVIVNDVTGLNNPDMVEVVTKLKANVIISNLPKMSIQEAHKAQPVGSVAQVKKELLEKALLLEAGGLPRENIILDPGIGFGKTMELNKELLKFAEQVPSYDVMIGYSRKRFLGEQRMSLEPNIQAGKIAAAHGAKYLRVHDVAEHADSLR
jgi:dihydropteroate synthase